MIDTKIAVIGMGGMGGGMALRLIDADAAVTVFNRTAQRCAPMVEAGAATAPTAAEAVAEADIVLVSVADEGALEEVIFGSGGIASGIRPGVYLVDASTASPTYSIALAKRLAELDVTFVEARMLGNPLHARSGELRVFAAGAAADVDAVRPMLEVLGQEVRALGPIGAASTFKLAFNVMLGAQLAAMTEAVGYAERAGLSRDVLLHAFGNSGLASPVLAFRCSLALQQRFDPPAFRTRLMHKDLALALADSRSPMPVIAKSARYFSDAVDQGMGELDAAIVLTEDAASTGKSPLAQEVLAR